jgi:hypothetical protein
MTPNYHSSFKQSSIGHNTHITYYLIGTCPALPSLSLTHLLTKSYCLLLAWLGLVAID